jgi:hypothetical protein
LNAHNSSFGPERQERVSQHESCGEACVKSRRRVNLDVECKKVRSDMASALKLQSCKTVVVVLLCAAGMAVVLARAPAEELLVKITLVTGEHGRDSNSTSTSLTIEGNKLFYEQTYHGFHANRRGPVQKQYELTANDRNVLIGLLREKNLLVNRSLTGSSQNQGARNYFSLSINSKLSGKEYSINIDGARDDAKLKQTDLYRDSLLLIEHLYKIINRTDPDITMPALIN